MLVEASVYERVVEIAAKVAATVTLGDPMQPGPHLGPVVSKVQFDKIQHLIQVGIDEGARVVAGGVGKPAGFERGYYVKPTVFADVTNQMTIAREEVFGPVLAVLPFQDEAEAVRLANDSRYGLASAVWTGSLSRAHRMVRAVKAGVVHVNTYGGPDITVPLGGVRQSGNGHDKSMHALDKYLDLKTAWIQL